MDVIVDHTRHWPVEGNPSDLLSVVSTVSDSLKQEGRVILSLRVDGQELSPENVAEATARPLTEQTVVEITSEEVVVLADRAMQELEEVLPELPKACHALAAVFQGSAPSEGFEPFQQLANIWGAVKERELQVARVLECSLEEIRIDGQPVLRMHEELNGYLEEAIQALQSGDCVLLGDLLEYELAPRAQQEAGIVAALRRHALQPTA